MTNKNIAYKQDLVKCRSKNYDIFRQVFLLFINKFYPDSCLPIERFSGHSEYDIDTTATNHLYQRNCPFQIQRQMVHPTLPEPERKHKHRSPEEKYPELAAEMHKGFVTNRTLIETYKTRLRERNIIMGLTEDSIYWIRRCMQKGDKNYNLKYLYKVLEKGRQIQKLYKYVFFLTLTYDVATYGEDLILGWKKFNHHVALTEKSLRKKMKFGYVGIMESTNKGRPHIHIVMGSNDERCKIYDNYSPGRLVKEGWLFHHIKRQVHSPVFDLQKANAQDLGGYLVKYLEKTTKNMEPILNAEKYTLLPATRKALLSIMMPIMARVRQFRFSQQENEITSEEPPITLSSAFSKADEYITQTTTAQQPANNDTNNVSKPSTDKLIEMMKEDIRIGERWNVSDSHLIYILNNLPCMVGDKVWINNNKAMKGLLHRYSTWYNEEKPPYWDYITKNSRCLHCPGCFIRDFYEYLKTGQMPTHNYFNDEPMPPPMVTDLEKHRAEIRKKAEKHQIDVEAAQKNKNAAANTKTTQSKPLTIQEVMDMKKPSIYDEVMKVGDKVSPYNSLDKPKPWTKEMEDYWREDKNKLNSLLNGTYYIIDEKPEVKSINHKSSVDEIIAFIKSKQHKTQIYVPEDEITY